MGRPTIKADLLSAATANYERLKADKKNCAKI